MKGDSDGWVVDYIDLTGGTPPATPKKKTHVKRLEVCEEENGKENVVAVT